MNFKVKIFILGIIIVAFASGIYYINADKTTFRDSTIQKNEKKVDNSNDNSVNNSQELTTTQITTSTTAKSNYTKEPESIVATKEYYCGSDLYVVEGTKCVRRITSDAFVNYYCAEGDLIGNLCYIGHGYETRKEPAMVVNYYCVAGYELNGDKCVYTVSFDAGVKYSCPTGYTLKNSICYK